MNYTGVVRREDFVVAQGEDDQGQPVWKATCLVCGESFVYMSYRPRKVIRRWQDHVHQSERDLEAILSCSGQPGADSDTVLRAIGVPEELI